MQGKRGKGDDDGGFSRVIESQTAVSLANSAAAVYQMRGRIARRRINAGCGTPFGSKRWVSGSQCIPRFAQQSRGMPI